MPANGLDEERTTGSFPTGPPKLTHRIILETDAAAIAGRVTRPRPDTTDIVINEQTLLNAYSTFKERVSARIQQL